LAWVVRKRAVRAYGLRSDEVLEGRQIIITSTEPEGRSAELMIPTKDAANACGAFLERDFAVCFTIVLWNLICSGGGCFGAEWSALAPGPSPLSAIVIATDAALMAGVASRWARCRFDTSPWNESFFLSCGMVSFKSICGQMGARGPGWR
jgi:hypothetical protein